MTAVDLRCRCRERCAGGSVSGSAAGDNANNNCNARAHGDNATATRGAGREGQGERDAVSALWGEEW